VEQICTSKTTRRLAPATLAASSNLVQGGYMPCVVCSRCAGKVVDRHWYNKNKHIFPASRWAVYDPDKAIQGAEEKFIK
jgi:hypothetical protein